ncbi:MAG: ABC transporter ATP-binding protein [Alphaproteobacteria bacterium]|nr:ABC transporter ATP-binding protein [Alphaproteobacteria bacterium]
MKQNKKTKPEAQSDDLRKEDDVILNIQNLNIATDAGSDGLQDISLQLYRGEILCLLGQIDAGQAMLISAITNDYRDKKRIASGSVVFKGRNLMELSENDMVSLRGKNIAMLFQNPENALNPTMIIGMQLEEILQIHSDIPKTQQKEHCLNLLEQVGFATPASLYHFYPSQLTRGQCQKIMFAMAIALQPDILIADEPITALDVVSKIDILQMICDYKKQSDCGIIYITHDCALAADIADRIAVMAQGKLVECGTVKQIINKPQHDVTKQMLASVPSLKVSSLKTERRDLPNDAVNNKKLPHYMLELRGVSKAYQHTVAVSNLELQLPKGVILSIVGEADAGKTTLAKLIVGLEHADNGDIFIDGHHRGEMKKSDIYREHCLTQMIFQDPFSSLNPKHRVGHIIGRGLMVLQNKSEQEAWVIAKDYLELVGLKRVDADKKPDEFSAGHRQLIALARALALHPKLLIADEIVSKFDSSVQKEILELLLDLQKRLNLTIIFMTRDLRVAAKMSDFVAVMYQGKIVEMGLAKNVLAKPSHSYSKQLLNAVSGVERF